eukprot:UN12440
MTEQLNKHTENMVLNFDIIETLQKINNFNG